MQFANAHCVLPKSNNDKKRFGQSSRIEQIGNRNKCDHFDKELDSNNEIKTLKADI